ncbi:MAG: bifunctional transaldolase/phosoglucose isomerase [Planctomycetes bacterium]|nr:bifunctional transaldolase/phosoglucose isomerase [Planctomycetota bacterium]
MSNPLQQLPSFGQSIWLDFISRKILDDGTLARLVDAGEILGVTSNPAIFEKSIAEGVEYKGILARLRGENPKASAFELYEHVAIRDIQAAADVLRKVYDKTKGRDGYVSLEVTMFAGEDEGSILKEARSLWSRVARPNLMIKVPAVPAGIGAAEKLLAEGINVNVTLLFAVDTYAKVAQAYVAGVESFAKQGGDPSKVASVASFFVSRIDSLVDKLLEEKGNKNLPGKIAIANAKLAYAQYREIFGTPRWKALEAKGARTQRVLWASTGTKNKAYSDVLYVEELIGLDTVNTAPPATIDAFRDHGKPRASLEVGLDAARAQMSELNRTIVPMQKVTDQLLAEGLKLFSDAFVKLLAAVEASKSSASPSTGAPATNSATTWKLSEALAASVTNHLDEWKSTKKIARLWARDASIWTGSDESKWLGWLDAPAAARAQLKELNAFADEIKSEGFTHVLLLGMGGSSLCPDVLRHTFGARAGYPKLEVVDSTDPQQIAASERRVDLAKTLVLVASKSGSTLEPNIFEAYFWERVQQVSGGKAGRQFIAITDPGSKLELAAKQKGYRRVFSGDPAIGGRFSALSPFGLVPAALLGMDLERFLARVDAMAGACGANVAPASNPGVQLGVILGAAAKSGRDKLTLVCSPAFVALGAWLEQLIAESTGKLGKGIVPVDLEPLGRPELYGNDRLFAYIRLENGADKLQDAAIEALERAGQAVVRIPVADVHEIGAEFFRWEIATAVAGSLLGIHPFDQPDVEASKIATKELTSAYEKSGALPAEQPFFETGGLQLFADPRNAGALSKNLAKDAQLGDVLRAHFARFRHGDYFAVLAYIEMSANYASELQSLRRSVRDQAKVATCLGFGPRFLHSTGQAYKGGPNSGVFLQITCHDTADLQVPGAKYSFGTVKAAQARGDFSVLSERGRRALRVHITGDVRAGLARLREAVALALTQYAPAGS